MATNASLTNSVILPSTIVSFADIVNPPTGKPIKKRCQCLDKVHTYIVIGECVALVGHRYDPLLVYFVTRYCWIYGMSSLSSTSITSALEIFNSESGQLTKRFHSDFDRKMIGGNALFWILANGSNIIAAPAGRQSSNGLSELTWNTLIQIARAYITENNWQRILVLYGFSCRNDAQISSGTFRPETHHTF